MSLLRWLLECVGGGLSGSLIAIMSLEIGRRYGRWRARRLATAEDADIHVIERPAKTFHGKDAFQAHSVRERPDHTLSCRLATVEQLIQELQARAALSEGDCGLVVGLVIKTEFNGAPSMKTTLWRSGSRDAQLRVLHSMLRATNRDMLTDLQETKA